MNILIESLLFTVLMIVAIAIPATVFYLILSYAGWYAFGLAVFLTLFAINYYHMRT